MTVTANLTIAVVGRGNVGQGAGLDELMARAGSGDASALPRLDAELDAPYLWTGPGDLAAVAEASWITLIAGDQTAFAEALTRQAATMRAELEGPSPKATESILARRVVVAWLIANLADALCGQVVPDRTDKQQDVLIDRSERAARRLTTAVAALECLRTLVGAGSRHGAASRSAPGPMGDRSMPAIRPA